MKKDRSLLINKIIKIGDLSLMINKIKKRKVVLVGGCFDLIHYGHFAFLFQSKSKGDLLVIFLESEEFIQKNKRKNAFHTQQQRAEILAGLSFVDYVVLLPSIQQDSDYTALITLIKPSVIVITQGDPLSEKKRKQAESINAKIETIKPITGLSSSQISKYASISSN